MKNRLCLQTKRIPRTLLVPLLVISATAAAFGVVTASWANGIEAAAQKDVQLQMAVVLGGPGTAVDFTIDNQTGEDFFTSPIATNHNQIWITTPDKTRVEHFVSKDFLVPTIIKAKTSKTWTLDLAEVFHQRELKSAGVYKVQWAVEDQRSPAILVRK